MAAAPYEPQRLLCLSPFAPRADATHGGGRVMAQLLARLAQRQPVAVLYLRAPDEPAIDSALAAQCAWVEAVARPPAQHMRSWVSTLRAFATVLTGQPLWVGDFAAPAFGQRLSQLAQAWQPDIIQLEYHLMGQYLPALNGCRAPRILVQHEPGAPAALDKARSPSRQGRFLPWLDALAWRRYEARLLRQVQAVVVFTPRDERAVLSQSPGITITRIPFGMEIPSEPLNPLGSQPPSLVFVGNYMHAPNLEAANRLALQILPSVLQAMPNVRLFLVGDQAPPQLLALAGPNIIVTGRVPDVSPYLDQASLAVAPLSTGGGMRVKVLELLAAGKALVASRRAVEGLAVQDGAQVVIAESDDEFAQAILRLLARPDERQALAQEARAWACAHLSWDAAVQAYSQLYTSLRASASQ